MHSLKSDPQRQCDGYVVRQKSICFDQMAFRLLKHVRYAAPVPLGLV